MFIINKTIKHKKEEGMSDGNTVFNGSIQGGQEGVLRSERTETPREKTSTKISNWIKEHRGFMIAAGLFIFSAGLGLSLGMTAGPCGGPGGDFVGC